MSAATAFRYRLEYLVLISGMTLFKWLPRRLALLTGKLLGVVAYLLLASRRRVALENLRLVYAEGWDTRKLKRVARQSFESLGLLLVDFARMTRLSSASLESVLVSRDEEAVLRRLADGPGVLFFTAHFGSWELISYVSALWGHPIAVISRPADNPLVEQYATRVRSSLGNRVVSKHGAAREILKTLKRAESIGILIDQSVSPDRGVAGSFLGHHTYTTGALAEFAMRTRAPVVPIFMVRQNDGRHRLQVGEPIKLVHTGDRRRDVATNTQNYVQAVEEVVQQWPEQWLWCHRRWRYATQARAELQGAGQPS